MKAPPLGLLLVLVIGCVTAPPPVEMPYTAREIESSYAGCPYFNVYVDSSFEPPNKEKLFPHWRDAETYRTQALEAAATRLESAGWREVATRDEAAYVMRAEGKRQKKGDGSLGSPATSVSISATPKTTHHMYVASLNDSSFELSPTSIGVYQHIAVPYGALPPDQLGYFMDGMMAMSQTTMFGTVFALCDTRAELTGEGTSLEELRKELFEEIQRRRAERRREIQEKQLTVSPDL